MSRDLLAFPVAIPAPAASAATSLRPTRAEIDLDAIAHNLSVLRTVASRSAVFAVVKADAYGHGVVPVAERLQAEGVDGFGVALAEEGLELRARGIERPILVLNGVYGAAHREVLQAGLTPVVYRSEEVRAFARAADGHPFRAHLKIDSGMGRLGVTLRDLPRFLEETQEHAGFLVEGLMTHFACADVDPDHTAMQLAEFAEAYRLLRAAGHHPAQLHAANSAGTFRHPEAHFDAIRPGIALFGYAGADDLSLATPSAREAASSLRGSLRFRSEVVSLRDLPEGATVGYGHGFVTRRPTRIATVPVGYGDGLLTALGNRTDALVGGRRVPLVGRVSMDLTTLDVTDHPGVAIGDEVVFLGRQGGEEITAEEVARAAATIPYEVRTNVSRRVPRSYP